MANRMTAAMTVMVMLLLGTAAAVAVETPVEPMPIPPPASVTAQIPAAMPGQPSAEEIAATYSNFSVPRKEVTIGLLVDGAPRREDFVENFKAEIMEVAGKSFDIRFEQAQGDWTVSNIRQSLNTLLANPKVDIIIALGVVGSVETALRAPHAKPVIAARVLEPAVLGIPQSDGKSGVKNLSYLASENPLSRDVRQMLKMRPFKKLAVIANGQLEESIKELQSNLLTALREFGVEVATVPANGDTAATLSAIPAGTEAVYFGPTTNLTDGQFAELAAAVNARRLFSFSLMGPADVRAGALATLQPEGEPRRLARRVANYTYRILNGADAGGLDTMFEGGTALTINMETARAIGYTPAWDLLDEAEVLNEEPAGAGVEYTLVSAVQAALQGNLDLSEKERALRASAQNIPAARANLLPQAEVSTTYAAIDSELASAVQPERLWTGSLKVTQLVFNEMALANVEIQKRLQEALEHEYAGAEMDIIKLAADAYFNVLRAKTFETIQKTNLRRTRTHLDLARLREEIGVAGPGEVYRLEAYIAESRVSVSNAGAQRKAAEIQFNRVLNRNQDELFHISEMAVDEDILLSGEKQLQGYLTDPERFPKLCGFLVETGLNEAPELHQLDKAIEAGGRMYLAAKRKYYLPTVGVQLEMKHKFDMAGKGAGGGLQTLIVPGVPDDSYTVGIQGSLPIYTGGQRKAERVKARESLEQLKTKRAAVAQKLEQRIRTAAEMTRASHFNISQARAAAEAANKNLGLVSDGYARGVLDVTSLVDAQNAALVADTSAAASVYTFMLDMMELYRAIAVAGFLESPENRALWLGKLEAWCAGLPQTTAPAVVDASPAPVEQ